MLLPCGISEYVLVTVVQGLFYSIYNVCVFPIHMTFSRLIKAPCAAYIDIVFLDERHYSYRGRHRDGDSVVMPDRDSVVIHDRDSVVVPDSHA
jgi:hypothetical protein